MDRYVTHRARLVLLCLVMERRNPRSRRIHRQRVALKAKHIHLATFKQAWIRGSMRRMTGDASFGFHRSMFEDKGSGFVGMTGEANLILRGCGSQLPCQEAAMWIVTVTAGD